MGKEFIPSAIGAAVKTIGGSGGGGSSGGGGGGGSTASAQAAATQQALTIDTGPERTAEASYRKGIQSLENRQSFHTAMIQQQQGAQYVPHRV